MLKLFKKNTSHSLLAVLLVVFIIFDLKVPSQVANLFDSLLGRIIVISSALSLLAVNPLLGVLGIIAAYELLRRSEEKSEKPVVIKRRRQSPTTVPVKLSRDRDFKNLNEFPVTLEETVIKNMLPYTSNQYLAPPSYKPVLNSLYDAAKIDK